MDPVAAVVIVAVLGVSFWERKRTADSFERERETWAAERATLLHAARNPTAFVMAPTRAAPPRSTEDEDGKPKDLREYARVGTVQPIRDDDPEAA